MIIRLLLFLFFIITLQPASAISRSRYGRGYCYNFARLNVNAGIGMPFYNRTTAENGFLSRYIPSSVTSLGASFYLPLWRTGGFGIGAASTQFSFEHQVEGNFTSSNQFGVINTKYDLRYVTVPVSMYFQPGCRSVLRIAYTPGFLVNETYHPLVYGGAAGQDVSPLMLRGDFNKVQHSVSFSLASAFRVSRNLFCTLEPYASYSFGHIDNTGTRGGFKPVTVGLAANADMNVSGIDIAPFRAWREARQEEKRKKAEELRKRKEETERKAREHIEQMKNRE